MIHYIFNLKDGGKVNIEEDEVRSVIPSADYTIIILKDGSKWNIIGKYSIRETSSGFVIGKLT